MILLEILAVALIAIGASRLLAPPWKGRAFSALKLWLTVRCVWLLLEHPVKLEEGGPAVPAWELMAQQIREIDASVFWTFVLLATGIKLVGVLCSMLRWQLLLRGQGIELPFRHIFGSFLIGRAIGFFLPSTAGLDAYLLYDAARLSGRSVEVTAGKFLEKVIGLSGIFLTFLVALPFGLSIFGENGLRVALVTVPFASGVLGALLLLLFFPGLVQWILETVPIPAKDRLTGLVERASHSAAAYRDKKLLVVTLFVLSFLVHFTTAAMYFFAAIAVGAGAQAEFWPIVFGSSIQIFATVIGPTIGGIGVREAAQLLTLGALIGPGAAIVSATLGFWAGEFPTLFGFFFWVLRGKDYKPAYCRVNGVQVDYEAAAKAALELEDPTRPSHAEAQESGQPSLIARIAQNAGLGLGTGILAGLLIGAVETAVLFANWTGDEAQVLWYGPLSYAVVLGGLSLLGGAFLGVLPMHREESQSWTPTLGLAATLPPFGLAVAWFRIMRDVFHEQMPLYATGLLVLGFGALALAILFFGRRVFSSAAGSLVRPGPALAILAAITGGGALLATAYASGTRTTAPGRGIPPALAERPNLILVMVDTLRADHLSCYGDEQTRTPNLCSLADATGSRFDGFSHASWTKPATASLLSALLPTSHQAMSKLASVSDDVTLVSEALQSAGYTTGAIVSNVNLKPAFGFAQGFDEYTYLGPDYLVGAEASSEGLISYQIARKIILTLKPGLRFGDFYQDSQVVNASVFEWLERHREDRFFLFMHYMDPHDPYFEHPYNGNGVARVTGDPDPARAEELRALYRGEIEYLDAQFGVFLDRLRQLGLYENSVILMTSDHGEEFQEHGGWWHGLTLYDEQIYVPLLVQWNDAAVAAAAGEDGRLVRHIDVAPTLLGRAGVAVPPAMQGVDLVRTAPGDPVVYAEEDHEGNVLWALRTRDRKLIVANPGNPRGLPERELFLLDRDPGEQQNVHDGQPLWAADLDERAAKLREQALTGQVEVEVVTDLTPEECESLRLLGYVESCEGLN
ncbi:MAG: sulfatase-like hydrolase/transferase [Proteobacteria bacterium]|nr:sulfatase-like hydrolase/transferase [Pseudomonadota bacterium]